MTTAYTKTQLGNKLFTIEWSFDVSNSEVQGDAFEALDCKPVSLSSYMSGITGTDPTPKIYYSNLGDLPVSPGQMQAVPLSDAGDYHIQTGSPNAIDLPPATRWIFPRLEGNSGAANLKVAILFEAIV